MVIKVFISGISGSKEVKKRQQESLLILDTIKIDYKVIDITEPGHEEERDMMKEICKKRNSDALPLSPQFFNDDEYCGDWEDFFAASDDDRIHSFLKLEEPSKCELTQPPQSNGANNEAETIESSEIKKSQENVSDEREIAGEDETTEKSIDLEETHDDGIAVEQETEEVEEEAITLSPSVEVDDCEVKKSDTFEEEAVEE